MAGVWEEGQSSANTQQAEMVLNTPWQTASSEKNKMVPSISFQNMHPKKTIAF